MTTMDPKQQQHKRRRLVIFAGPHKSASSSVETFFQRFASNRGGRGGRVVAAAAAGNNTNNNERLSALDGWVWPWNPKLGGSYQSSKAFAILVNERNQQQKSSSSSSSSVGVCALCQKVYQSILLALKEYPTTNLIVGTEEFDRFGTTPWSHRDGIGAIRDLINVIQKQIHQVNKEVERDQPLGGMIQVEIVINYRRPRKDQWISIWRQLCRIDKKTYSEFMCPPLPSNIITNNYDFVRLWEYLDAVANPLGLVVAILNQLGSNSQVISGDSNYNDRLVVSKVHIIDMQGITDAGLDISHVIACQVLGAQPCLNGWLSLQGNAVDYPPQNHTDRQTTVVTALQENKKIGDPNLSINQLQDMETLFRLRDCSYRNQLESYLPTTTTSSTGQSPTSSVHIHYGESIWDGCPSSEQQHMERTSLSTDDMLEFLQDQVGCGSGRRSLSKANVLRWKKVMTAKAHDETRNVTIPSINQLSNNFPAVAIDKDSIVVGSVYDTQRSLMRPILSKNNKNHIDDASSLYRTAWIHSLVLLIIIIVLLVANLFHQFSNTKKRTGHHSNNKNKTRIGIR
jgi:hypothetical protein